MKIIPLPLNIFPLPAKWKIKFLRPIKLVGYTERDVANRTLVHQVAREVQEKMQAAINKELNRRKWIYFPPPPPQRVLPEPRVSESRSAA